MIVIAQQLRWFLFVLCFFALLQISAAQAAENDNAYHSITWSDLVSRPNIANPVSTSTPHASLENEQTLQEAVAAYSSAWANAPINSKFNNQSIQINGFVVPLERDENNALLTFLLVPYFGACIHVPPPPVNQIIYVESDTPLPDIATMDQVSVFGTLHLAQTEYPEGAAYSLNANKVDNLATSSTSTLTAIILTVLSGLSICLGLLLASFVKKNSHRLFCMSISFAAGVMTILGLSVLAATLFSKNFSVLNLTLFVSGILFMWGLNLLLHRKHTQAKQSGFLGGKLAIALHSTPECFVIYSTSLIDYRMGLVLACITVLHNIPLGFSFALPQVTHRWLSAFFVALAPVLISIITYMFLRPFIAQEDKDIIFSLVGGMMLFIALKELMPSATQFGSIKTTLCGYFIGIVFALFAIFIAFYFIKFL